MTTLTLNQELGGIEISFDSKPIAATLEALKNNGFRWHNKKKLWYAKNTPEHLEMAQTIANISDYADIVKAEKRPAKKAEPVNKYGVKVGDVFYESWGWEQTNINFWQVVELRGATQIILRAINSEIVEQVGFCSNMVKPVKDSFCSHYAGEELRKTVKGTRFRPLSGFSIFKSLRRCGYQGNKVSVPSRGSLSSNNLLRKY